MRAKIGDEEFLREIDKAIAKIDAVLVMGKTTERFGIRASAHKRRAMLVGNNEERLRSLKEMTEAYQKSDELSGKSSQYSAQWLNWLLGEVVWGWFDSTRPDILTAANKVTLASRIDRGVALASTDPSFWNGVIEPDGRLGAVGGCSGARTLPIPLPSLVLTAGAKDQGGSPREVSTVVEHLDLVGKMAQAANKETLATTMARIIRYIETETPEW